ncbi:hypothetical protein [Streptomyces sp. NPDC002564]|uniref:hypothetical protein n=1 Tax=Streptomyces sp. NPDC002564 TaxID=3364649 RepID=UPI0036C31267
MLRTPARRPHATDPGRPDSTSTRNKRDQHDQETVIGTPRIAARLLPALLLLGPGTGLTFMPLYATAPAGVPAQGDATGHDAEARTSLQLTSPHLT